MDRYDRLFVLTCSLWRQGSPVMIESGELLRDSQDPGSGEFVRLSIRNLSPKTITGIRLKIYPAGGEPVNCLYADWNLLPGRAAGSGQLFRIPGGTVPSFGAGVLEVQFSDGTRWRCEEDAPWKPQEKRPAPASRPFVPGGPAPQSGTPLRPVPQAPGARRLPVTSFLPLIFIGATVLLDIIWNVVFYVLYPAYGSQAYGILNGLAIHIMGFAVPFVLPVLVLFMEKHRAYGAVKPVLVTTVIVLAVKIAANILCLISRQLLFSGSCPDALLAAGNILSAIPGSALAASIADLFRRFDGLLLAGAVLDALYLTTDILAIVALAKMKSESRALQGRRV